MADLEDTLSDGFILSKMEDKSRLNIIKAAIEVASRNDPKHLYTKLGNYWNIIMHIASKHPESNMVRSSMLAVKSLAKDKLPEEKYRMIYDWTN